MSRSAAQFFFSSLRFVLYCVLHFFKWLIQTHVCSAPYWKKKTFFSWGLQVEFFVAEKRLNLRLNPHRLRRSTCSEPHDWQREEDKRGVTLRSAYGEQPGQWAQLENMIRLKKIYFRWNAQKWETSSFSSSAGSVYTVYARMQSSPLWCHTGNQPLCSCLVSDLWKFGQYVTFSGRL